MLRLHPPTLAELDQRILLARDAPLSYRSEAVGVTLSAADSTVEMQVPTDYVVGEWEVELGRGEACYLAARSALERWEQFPGELVEIHPAHAPIASGTVVALSARAAPFHMDLACRIVGKVESESGDGSLAVRRFGFSYGTIEGHVERGEEMFLIEHRGSDDVVTYRILAISRSAHPLAWILQPWIRSLQRRFGRLSSAAMRRACDSPADLPAPRELRRRPSFGLPWIGALIFAAITLSLTPSLAATLLAFAPLVVLPAARALLPGGWLRSATASATWLGCATALALAPALGTGLVAALFTLPWLIATGAVAIRAIHAIVGGRRESHAEFSTLLGLILLPVGSAWATMFRFGSWPGGFPDPVPLLTALHFHYAGAVLPIVLGRAVAATAPRLVRPLALAWLGLTSAVAVGISFSPLLEGLSAVALLALAAVVAGFQLRAGLRTRSALGGFLLVIGSAALLSGIALAGTYAIAEALGAARGAEEYSGGGLLGWGQMVPWHGTTMAVGFALCSVLGWDAARESSPASASESAPQSSTDELRDLGRS